MSPASQDEKSKHKGSSSTGSFSTKERKARSFFDDTSVLRPRETAVAAQLTIECVLPVPLVFPELHWLVNIIDSECDTKSQDGRKCSYLEARLRTRQERSKQKADARSASEHGM